MEPFSWCKTGTLVARGLAVAVLLFPVISMATGPRVGPSLFVPAENEIFAADQPPFISTTSAEQGLVTAIAVATLEADANETVITTLPLRRMVKYHLMQEQAIAVLGSRFNFTAAQKETLIFVPLLVSPAYYLYYKPTHKAGLTWDGALQSLSGLRYGALKDEDVRAYESAGIEVVFGSERSLLKKLKSGEVDFIRLTPLAADWQLDKHFGDGKTDFTTMERAAGEIVFQFAFNSQHKNGRAVAASVRGALAEMIGDGRYIKVLESHLGRVDGAQAYLKRLEEYLGR